MRILLRVFSIVVAVVSQVLAQEATISNVTWSQTPTVTGTQVDLFYDLASPGGNCTITVQFSKDGGASFPYGISTATGDIGANVTPGAGRHVVWLVGADYPNEFIAQARFRILADVHAAGSGYAVGTRDITYYDPSRGNRSITCRTRYPAQWSGSNAPIAGGPGVVFPVVVFGHGWLTPTNDYTYLWNQVVPAGYIMLMVDTETGVAPNQEQFARDMAFVVDSFQLENFNSTSFFFGKVAPASAASGHSMGGGASIVATLWSANITTIVTLAAAQNSAPVIDDAAYVTQPALMISGASDCMAVPNDHQVPMYNAMPSACKYFASIVRGSHCQFCENSTNCIIAQSGLCFGRSYVSRGTQEALTGAIMINWLDAKLKGRHNRWLQFEPLLASYATQNLVTYYSSCAQSGIGLSTAGVIETVPPSLSVFYVEGPRSMIVAFTDDMWWTSVGNPANYGITGVLGNLTPTPSQVEPIGGSWYRLLWTSGEMLHGAPLHLSVSNAQDGRGNVVWSGTGGDGAGIGSLPTGSVSINGGAAYALSPDVQLTLSATDPDTAVTGVQISNDGGTWSDWQPFTASYPWALSTGDGEKRVYARYRDEAGNISAGNIEAGITLDSTSPIPVITGPATPTNTSRTLTVDFGEVVNGFWLGAIDVANGSATNLQPAGPAASYTVDLIGSGTVTITVSLDAGRVTDNAGNPNLTSAPFTYDFDEVPPTPTIVGSAMLTNAVRTLIVDFGEMVSGVQLSSILVENGEASNLQPSGPASSYTVDVLGSGTVSVSVSLEPAGIADQAGNPSNEALPFSYPFDGVAPVPVIIGQTTLTNAVRSLSITFGENINNFSLPGGISVINGTASNLQAAGAPGVFTVDITGSGENIVSVAIPGGVAADDAANPNLPTAAAFSYPFDDVPPTPVISGSNAPINHGRNLTITFGENVNGFSLPTGVLCVNGTVSNLEWTGVAGTYTVLIAGSNPGMVFVSVPDGVTADDAGNLNYAVAEPFAFAYDPVPPTPTIGGATSLTNTTRTLTVSFGEAVNGFALPGGLSVTNGTGSNLQPTANPGEYTVDILGTGTNTVSVSVPSGAAMDDAGNANSVTAAPFTFPFDGDAPTAAIALDDPTPTDADTIHFSVAFSENVGTTFDTSDVSVTGTVAGVAVVTGPDPDYTVTITLANPAANGTVGISVGAGVMDLIGNAYAGGTSPLYTIANWPGFANEPTGGRFYTGDYHKLEVTVDNGLLTPTYQWKFDDDAGHPPVDGPTTPTWQLNGLAPADTGDYWCEVTYNGIMYLSETASVTVVEHLAITNGPAGGQEPIGGSHIFTVATSGGYQPLTYAWKKDGATIPGATESTYTRSSLTTDDAGTYTVDISDANSDIRTASANLTVGDALPVAGAAVLALLAVLLGILVIRRHTRQAR